MDNGSDAEVMRMVFHMIFMDYISQDPQDNNHALSARVFGKWKKKNIPGSLEDVKYMEYMLSDLQMRSGCFFMVEVGKEDEEKTLGIKKRIAEALLTQRNGLEENEDEEESVTDFFRRICTHIV